VSRGPSRKSPDDALLDVRERCLAALVEHLKASGKTQAQLARDLSVTPSRVSALMLGRAEEFRLDMLLTLSIRAGGTVTADELVTFPRSGSRRKS
jgi:predicted XRE-type DNA-binding protein